MLLTLLAVLRGARDSKSRSCFQSCLRDEGKVEGIAAGGSLVAAASGPDEKDKLLTGMKVVDKTFKTHLDGISCPSSRVKSTRGHDASYSVSMTTRI
jgi:hypothetical protein